VSGAASGGAKLSTECFQHVGTYCEDGCLTDSLKGCLTSFVVSCNVSLLLMEATSRGLRDLRDNRQGE
jgi:hypothetical protein